MDEEHDLQSEEQKPAPDVRDLEPTKDAKGGAATTPTKKSTIQPS